MIYNPVIELPLSRNDGYLNETNILLELCIAVNTVLTLISDLGSAQQIPAGKY